MIIGLVGLHGSGKSHLSRILEDEFGWINVNKRQLLERMFSMSFSSPEIQESIDWYHYMYKSYGVVKIMELVLEGIPKEGRVILDAIHNPREWLVVKNMFPKSMLVGVFVPQLIRSKRNSPQDVILDKKRIRYWHECSEDSSSDCLMSEIEWVFTGVNSLELQRRECQEFMDYLKEYKHLD